MPYYAKKNAAEYVSIFDAGNPRSRKRTRRNKNRRTPETPASIEGRERFSAYCQRAAYAAKTRAAQKGIPCEIDFDFIERMIVDQNWRCAVSGISFHTPTLHGTSRDPFGPSVDRINSALGYVPSNVRIVCNIVNCAINEWGIESLERLVKAMSGQSAGGSVQAR